jgi:hypothetical protein
LWIRPVTIRLGQRAEFDLGAALREITEELHRVRDLFLGLELEEVGGADEIGRLGPGGHAEVDVAGFHFERDLLIQFLGQFLREHDISS